MITEDPSITYDRIQAHLGIGLMAVETILSQLLHVKKVVAKFVPHVLTNDQKRASVEFCQTMLSKFQNGHSSMVRDIVSGDET